MSKPEEKKCPRCKKDFECKAGDILKCQCYGISIAPAEEAYTRSKFADCLCRNCLEELSRHHLFVEQKDLQGGT